MSTQDDFTATVGVALIESAGLLPWTAPLPPALPGARGWYMPDAAGPSAVFVLPADALDAEALSAAIAAWRGWLEGLRVDAAILLVVTTNVGEETEPRGEWLDHPRWQPWLVDLASRRIERPAPEEGADAPPLDRFGQAVDAAVVSYFQGPAMTLTDLAEEERDRLAGKAPFLAWLDTQPAPASYLLLGLVVGLYLITALTSVGPLGPHAERSAWELGGVLVRGLLYPSTIALMQLGATFGPLVVQGEVWRLLAANYLHGNWIHILVGTASIAAMAPTLEKIFGTPKFLAIWTLAGATGAAASVAVNHDAIGVGASGALFGLVGAMLALGARFRGAIPGHQIRALRHVALVLLGFNLLLGATIPNIDNYAHLGGLFGGFTAAFLLGPHPALTGRKPGFLGGLALGVFPLLAVAAIATGLASSATGRMPQVALPGPTRDYVVTLPIDVQVTRDNQYLIVRSTRGEHYVLVHSVPNPEGEPAAGQPAFTEATLDARVYEVARRYATQGARLVDSPAVVTGGHHRFLMIPIAMPEGGREEIYVTASASRIYAIRTRGLTIDPWVRHTRDQLLATFEMRSPHPTPPPLP